MGGRAVVMVLGADAFADRAERRVHALEARWSRFIDTSDISRANRQAGIPTLVSPETITLCTLARHAWEMTEGRFDPLLGVPLAQLGYDRAFASIDRAGPPTSVLPLPARGAEGLLVDADRGEVTVPAGRQFDPGGIGKGLAGDLVVEDLLQAGARGVLVSLGGDVRVGGENPEGCGWPIAVEDPRTDQAVLFHARLIDGAIASSSRRRRCWTSGGLARHHLLDPADGRPLQNGITAVSVLAGSGWEAEALTKAAFVAGADDAGDLVSDHGAEGVVILDDGTCRWSPGLAEARR